MLQHSIKHSVCVIGKGLHSGKLAKLTLKPTTENSGIIVRRLDLDPVIDIKICHDKIYETPLCTRVYDQHTEVLTVEHLFSALAGLQIDNIILELDGPEIPILDGSSAPFIFLLEAAGILEQNQPRRFLHIKKVVRLEEEDKYVELSPAQDYQLDVSIDFTHPAIQATPNRALFHFSPSSYIKEVSRARTFGIASQLKLLQEKGLALGASLDNAIGLSEETVLNSEGLRLKDEFVRHKLLDAIGDLYVIGPIKGHFRAHKPSHALNNRLLKAVLADDQAYGHGVP